MAQNSRVFNIGHTEDDTDKIFAVVPVYLHEIRSTATPASDIFTFPIDVYTKDLEVKRTHWFEFEGQDWLFNWTGNNPISDSEIGPKIHRQFEITKLKGREPAGAKYDFPLPKFTKVEIKKRGRYHLKAGIVLSNTPRRLRILLSDLTETLVAQEDLDLLDPDLILPFGFPKEN